MSSQMPNSTSLDSLVRYEQIHDRIREMAGSPHTPSAASQNVGEFASSIVEALIGCIRTLDAPNPLAAHFDKLLLGLLDHLRDVGFGSNDVPPRDLRTITELKARLAEKSDENLQLRRRTAQLEVELEERNKLFERTFVSRVSPRALRQRSVSSPLSIDSDTERATYGHLSPTLGKRLRTGSPLSSDRESEKSSTLYTPRRCSSAPVNEPTALTTPLNFRHSLGRISRRRSDRDGVR